MSAPTPKSLTISSILVILAAALNALGALPVVGPEAALASVFIKIIQAAMAAYQAATGQPLDLSKIPFETPVA